MSLDYEKSTIEKAADVSSLGRYDVSGEFNAKAEKTSPEQQPRDGQEGA